MSYIICSQGMGQLQKVRMSYMSQRKPMLLAWSSGWTHSDATIGWQMDVSPSCTQPSPSQSGGRGSEEEGGPCLAVVGDGPDLDAVAGPLRQVGDALREAALLPWARGTGASGGQRGGEPRMSTCQSRRAASRWRRR